MKKNNLIIFFAAVLFLGVFFVGTDKIKNTAKADCVSDCGSQDQCSSACASDPDPATCTNNCVADLKQCVSGCRSTTSSLLLDGEVCTGSATCQSGKCLADVNGQFTCTSCSSGYEAGDGTCYANETSYCAAVNDPTICGSSANTSGSAKQSLASFLLSQGINAATGAVTNAINGSNSFPGTGGSNQGNLTSTAANGATICNGDVVAGVCFPANTGLSSMSINDILMNFLDWVLGIFTILAVMAFVISGIQYLISAGDEHMIETAKTNAKWSIVGIIVGLSGFIMLQAVNALMNGTSQFF